MKVLVLFSLIVVVLVEGQVPTTSGECKDALPNCESYEITACHGIYAEWAKVNCAKRCVFCGMPPKATPPPPCKDKLPNCHEFQKDTCTQTLYHDWAEDNCRLYCGFCQGPAVATPPDPHHMVG